MRNKLGTVVFSQGWLENQFQSMIKRASETANEDPTTLLIANQIQEQWSLVSSALDDLIKENQEMSRKLTMVQSALV